jgi:hypothetical protein
MFFYLHFFLKNNFSWFKKNIKVYIYIFTLKIDFDTIRNEER